MITITDEQFLQMYSSTWQNIAREDSNIASRTGWSIGLSTGLFSAISFIMPGINDFCNGVFWPPLVCFSISCMSALALFFCFRTKIGVEAAHQQITYLRQHYLNMADDFTAMYLPRPFGDSSTGSGRKSSAVYPNALLIFWSLILLTSLTASIWTLSKAADPSYNPICQVAIGAKSCR